MSDPIEKLGHVVFVGELTMDVILMGAPGGENAERSFERTTASDADWLGRLAELSSEYKPFFKAGGSIANVAASFAAGERSPMSFIAVKRPPYGPVSLPLWWPGYSEAALDLSARGIAVYGRDVSRSSPEIPACFALARPDGSISELMVRNQTTLTPKSLSGTLLVIRSDHLQLMKKRDLLGFRSIAILLADDNDGMDLALQVLTRSARAWLFGRKDQIRSLAVGDERFRNRVTLVGTSGDQPVFVADGTGEYEFSVPKLLAVGGSDLGAGDAYMGGFLRRAQTKGTTLEQAHRAGCVRAASVLATVGARTAPSRNLNEIFPRSIARVSSSRREGALLPKVHRAPGLAVITGGQSGVEDFATHYAAEAGIATHVIMPRGRRREPGSKGDSYDGVSRYVRVHELATESFRFRTWASVYAADAVLLLDYTKGEGSAETRLAAHNLNRPLLDVADASIRSHEISAWLKHTAPETVLIAGNRLSRLVRGQCTSAAQMRVAQVIDALVLEIQAREAHNTIPPTPEGMVFRGPLALPRSLWENAHVRRALENVAAWTDVKFMTPREVAEALSNGAADHGVTWPSLLPRKADGVVTLKPLGVAAIYYGFVGFDRTLSQGVVGVQYTDAYSRYVPANTRTALDTVEIGGGAEDLIRTGRIAAAFDTFRTGRSIDAAGVSGFWPVAWESVGLISVREQVQQIGACRA